MPYEICQAAQMTDLAYKNYWERKKLKASACPRFTVLRCSGQAVDGEVLAKIVSAIANKKRLLDLGAGNLEVKKVLRDSGFDGEYETLDVGTEFAHTYTSIDQIAGHYGAILLLDVIEHLPLAAGLDLLHKSLALLEPGGVLVVQTPNGRCVRSPFTSDMTHVQSYNLADLWAYLTALGSNCSGHRVVFDGQASLLSRAENLLSRIVVTRMLGLDYADNILLFARK